MTIQSTDNIRVTKNNGFVAVSLSKVVEISSNSLCMICINGPDYELDELTSIFAPIPEDEILTALVSDIIADTETGVDKLFEMAEEIQGEFSMKVRLEDYVLWKESYLSELATLVLDNLPDKVDDNDVTVEVVIMKNVPDLIFILIANSDMATVMLDKLEDDDEESEDEEVIEYEESDTDD